VHLAVVPPISVQLNSFLLIVFPRTTAPSIPLAGPDSISVIGLLLHHLRLLYHH
jgi:hypothetical protein